MTESGYYPSGSEHDPNAPWNQPDPQPLEVSVCVSITLSKTVKIKVSDYNTEEGNLLNFSDCNLKEAVCQQISLPNEQFPDWTVDDFEVILDD